MIPKKLIGSLCQSQHESMSSFSTFHLNFNIRSIRPHLIHCVSTLGVCLGIPAPEAQFLPSHTGGEEVKARHENFQRFIEVTR